MMILAKLDSQDLNLGEMLKQSIYHDDLVYLERYVAAECKIPGKALDRSASMRIVSSLAYMSIALTFLAGSGRWTSVLYSGHNVYSPLNFISFSSPLSSSYMRMRRYGMTTLEYSLCSASSRSLRLV
jgi:hypothetical protein